MIVKIPVIFLVVSVVAFCTLLRCVDVRAVEPPITALAFSPDSELIAVGSQNGVSIRHWPSLEWIANIEPMPPAIHAIRWDDEQLIVAGGTPGESGYVGALDMRVTSIATGVKALHAKAIDVDSSDVVYDLARAPDRRHFAWASLDGIATVMRDVDREPILRLDGHSAGLTGIAWIDDKHLATSSRDTTIRIWDISTGTIVRTLNHHTDQIVGIARSPSDSNPPVMASIGDDRTIRFWRPSIGRMMRFIRLDKTHPTVMAWTPDGRSLFVGTRSGAVLEINPTNALPINERVLSRDFPAAVNSDDWITALAVSSQHAIACGTAMGQVIQVTMPQPDSLNR
jgi:WD40 repeat protein